MPKHMLSTRQVQVAREGDTHDGEGLILRVQKKAASWVLRYRVASGKRRELGLGAADRSSIEAAGASLTGARELADEARRQLKRGIDPIDARRAERRAEWDAATKERGQAAAAATTLRNYAKAYHEKHVEPLRTFKHGQQWTWRTTNVPASRKLLRASCRIAAGRVFGQHTIRRTLSCGWERTRAGSTSPTAKL